LASFSPPALVLAPPFVPKSMGGDVHASEHPDHMEVYMELLLAPTVLTLDERDRAIRALCTMAVVKTWP
jgi:hypothetical protein